MLRRNDRARLLPGLLGACILAAGVEGTRAQPSEIWEFHGTAAGDFFGVSVASPGDLDGDGVSDILIGSPHLGNFPSSTPGEAMVFSGATGLLLFVFTGTAALDRFGLAVAGVGDLDGDGVPDFAVGAPGPYFPTPAAGSVRVFSGGTGNPLFTWTGATPLDGFGIAIAGPGDLDGDSVPDVLVGASAAGSPFPGAAGSGEVWAFSGASGASLYVLTGAAAGVRFGHEVAGVGDLDGDAIPDFVVGAPERVPMGLSPIGGLYPPGGAGGSGSVRAYSGASGQPLWTVAGVNMEDKLGWALVGAGDRDGDGVPDVFAGAPEAGGMFVFEGPGEVWLLSGTTGALLASWSGAIALDEFGAAIDLLEDMDGDGLGELVVGAPYQGPTFGGTVWVYGSSTGNALAAPAGRGYLFGASLAGASDLDGDGWPDLLVANPTEPGGPGLYAQGSVTALSIVGLPLGATLFGSGCPGSGGLAPGISPFNGPATSAGNVAFGVMVRHGLPGASAILIAGLSFTSWGGVGLPMSLAPFGIPSCSLLVSPDVLLGATLVGSGPAAGTATVPIPIPPNPALSGSLVHFQWYVVDPGPFPVPGAMSRGMQVFVL